MTNAIYSDSKNQGGYQNLLVYQQALLIYDLTVAFCHQYLASIKDQRTVDQMIQAGRSGKQNIEALLCRLLRRFASIVEGSLEKSLKLNIKLTGVARASFGELLEDYKDYLRTFHLELWGKEDSRVLEIRALRLSPNETNKSNGSNLANVSPWSFWTSAPGPYSNLMISLISRENYLLDQMIRALEAKFINEGGYTENLFRKRLEQRRLDK